MRLMTTRGSHQVLKPGPVLPVFWTGSFLKNSFLDRQIFP